MIEHAGKETETAIEHTVKGTESTIQRGVEALGQQSERVEETGREAERQASRASGAALGGVARTGSTLVDATKEIIGAWASYVADVMRNTSQASEALLRSRTIPEIMQAQVALMRDNVQSFLDQSAKLAETTSRIATRPFEALKEESAERAPR
jgi:hypothetical protein